MSNKEMEDNLKIVKSLADSGLLLNVATEIFQNEVKEQKGGFLSMLLSTLGASLLGNILTGRGAMAKSVSKETKSKRKSRGINGAEKRRGINRAGEGVLSAGYGIVFPLK